MIQSYHQLFGLQGRDIWFFGGAGYLGSRSVLLALSAGARVLCIDRDERAECFARQEATDFGEQVTAASLDISDTAASERFIEEQVRQRGVPDGIACSPMARRQNRSRH